MIIIRVLVSRTNRKVRRVSRAPGLGEISRLLSESRAHALEAQRMLDALEPTIKSIAAYHGLPFEKPVAS